MNHKPDPNPREMPDRALYCAIEACKSSQWRSDRDFAQACEAEVKRRFDERTAGQESE